MTQTRGARMGCAAVYSGTLLLLAFVQATARADLRFLEPLVDVGGVRSGAPLSHEFHFVNSGPGVAEVTELRGSCGCLKPRLDQRVYQPGEEGALLLEVNTLRQSEGSHRWSVYIAYRQGRRHHETTVQLLASVGGDVTVQPAALTVFADDAVSHDLVLTDQRPQPLSITRVMTSSPQLRTTVTATARDPSGRAIRRVHLEVAGDYPEGRHDEFVNIYTDDPSYRELRVPVTVIKKGGRDQRLSATPSQVALLVPQSQAAASQVILLRGHDGQPVVVEEVVADDAAVTCYWAAGPGPMATIRLSIAAERISNGMLETQVHVRTSQPRGQLDRSGELHHQISQAVINRDPRLAGISVDIRPRLGL